MTAHYLVHGLFATAGVLSLLAALFDWNWFFTAQNTRFIVHHIGRFHARIFYGVLGVLLIVLALFFFLKYI